MDPTVFIGIDFSFGKKPYYYAALDADLRLFALGEGDMREVIAFCSGQQAAFVGMNCPAKASVGLISLEEVHQQMLPPIPDEDGYESRIAEYKLNQRGIRVQRVPLKTNTLPAWLRHGVNLYRNLWELGYDGFTNSNTQHKVFEVHAEVVFRMLIGHPPYVSDTFEGRLQRQLILFENDVSIPDPMSYFEEITRFRILQGKIPVDLIYAERELNAIAIAYTAWSAYSNPHNILAFGNQDDQKLILPVVPKP